MTGTKASDMGPSAFDFDTSDRPSMGDPHFVDAQVRAMFEEARRLLFGVDDPNASPRDAAPALIQKWATIFDARNPDFVQTMTAEAQDCWLKAHGCGSEDTEPGAPVLALVAHTLGRFVEACSEHVAGRIDDDQARFWIDAAIEDCACLLLGLENSAD